MWLQGSQGTELDKYLTSLLRSNNTVELKEKWVNPNPELKKRTLELFPDVCQNHHVFDPRAGERPKTVVTIRSIKGTEYEHIRDDTCLSVYAGGPGSMVGAALDSALSNPDASFNSSSSSNQRRNVMYVTYDFHHSNARSSAYYFHVRHSNALSADSLVRGPRILLEFFRRQLTSPKKLELEARKLGYIKVDVSVSGIVSSPAHCLNTVTILLKGLCHTYRNVFIDAISPSRTDWTHNRSYSQISVPILRYLEATGEQLGVAPSSPNSKLKLLVGTENDTNTPKAIHVVFDEMGASHSEKENAAIFKTNKINSRQLSATEIADVMGNKNHGVFKAFVYPGDGRIMADMNLTLREIVEKTSNAWQEGIAVESVYVDKKGVRGVTFRDVQSKRKWYQPCTSVVLSLGYAAKYEFEEPRLSSQSIFTYPRSLLSSLKWKMGLSRPVPSTTVATGCSGYFLVKGKIPIIGAQNSHWTEVAYNSEENVTLAKLTGGGNIGSEYVPATYAINNLEHLRKLFKDRLVDVLSIDSCPRSINPENDIQFYRLVPGLVISLGLGGTGMTKSGANGALSYLLTHPSKSPSNLIPNQEDLFSAVDTRRLANEYTSRTLRALNLKNSFSPLEVVSVGMFGLGIYLVGKKLSRLVKGPPISSSRSSKHSVNQVSLPRSVLVQNPTVSSPWTIHHRSLHSIPNHCCYKLCCNLRLLSFFQNTICRIRL